MELTTPVSFFDWLVDAHRTHALGSTRRVRESFHRHAEATAVGLDLPGVPHDARCLFSGHKTIFNAMGATLRQRQSALASGCSFWSVHGGQRVPDDDPRTECMCGLRYPSRPHLVWACDATADLRVGIAPPVNRVEERLFGKIIPEWPAPPPVVHGHHEAVEFFADCLHHVACGQRSVFIGVDGSSKHGVATFAAAVHPHPVATVVDVDGEDQSAFRAEVSAIVFALTVLQRFLQDWDFPRVVFLISDCKSALDLALSIESACPLLAKRIQELLVELKAGGFLIHLSWVPAHGRVAAGWSPPDGLPEAVARGLNHIVDVAANRRMTQRLAGSDRAQWYLALEQATQWEMSVVRAVALCVDRYRTWLQLP